MRDDVADCKDLERPLAVGLVVKRRDAESPVEPTRGRKDEGLAKLGVFRPRRRQPAKLVYFVDYLLAQPAVSGRQVDWRQLLDLENA